MKLQEHLFDILGGHWLSNGRYFSAWCPFDSHKKPALLVYQDGWVCLSCNKSGSLDYLLKVVSGKDVKKPANSSVNILPPWKKWERLYGNFSRIALEAYKNVKERSIYGYFDFRKISKFIDDGKFGYLDGWYIFPVFDQFGDIVNLVARSGKGKHDLGAKYAIPPNSPKTLYVPNWDRVKNSDGIYIVYGIITAWALEAINFPVITGITGKSLQAELLKDIPGRFTIIPDYNEDVAGIRLVNQLGWRAKLKLINYPDDCTDVDDIRRIYGEEKLKEILEE
jgi:hypothetical protein